MPTIHLQDPRWKAYFDWLSTLVGGKVEVQSVSLENAAAAEWLTLRGATYDRENDVLDLDFGTFHHSIDCPTHVHATTEDGAVMTITIEDSDGITSAYRCRLKRRTIHREHASSPGEKAPGTRRNLRR